MSDNKSLNRGLDALLGDQKLTTTTKEIDLEKITAGRYQPRQEFDDVKIQELLTQSKNTEFYLQSWFERLGLINLRS